MTSLLDILRGIVIGIANVIPGVSGGTMAVSMGIYDKLIGAVTGLFKHFKDSIKLLLPLAIGMAIGIVGFGFLLEYLLANFVLATCLTFVGLILGGLPVLWARLNQSLQKKQRKTIGVGEVISFLALLAAGVGLPLLQGAEAAQRTLSADPVTMLVLFILGIVASATMVIPGVSGSMVLMVLGYYNSILSLLTDTVVCLKDFDFAGILENCLLLVPFCIGVALGIFLIAKVIEYLFQNFPSQTFAAIIGLIVSSPFSILYSVNALAVIHPVELVVGIVLGALGAWVTLLMGNKEEA